MSINERIKIVRGKLSQREFGQRIGATRNQIAFAEGKDNTVSSLLITAICSVFGINATWLINGDGEMFAPTDAESPQVGRKLAEQYLLEKFRALPSELQEDVVAFCGLIVDEGAANLKKRLDVVSDSRRDANDEGTGTPLQ